MSVDYAVLKGPIVDTGRNEKTPGSKNHFHIVVDTPEGRWRCPVNIRSQDKSEVWFKIEQPIGAVPLLTKLEDLGVGLHEVPERRPGLALDYVREPLFDRGRMTHLPSNAPGLQNDIQDFIEPLAKRVQAEAGQGAFVCIFGSFWRNRAFGADASFGTNQGVHDVHMNQGNSPNFRGDDGVYQDGGVLFFIPSSGWVGVFCAFDSQCWFTDDRSGHALPGYANGPLAGLDVHPNPSEDAPVPDVPTPGFTSIAIIAALVNPVGVDEGGETVTLFNASADAVDLAGWKLFDPNGNAEVLAARTLPRNQSVTLTLSGRGAQLSNRGGTIRIVSPQGVQTDSVSYSKAQASRSGQIIRF